MASEPYTALAGPRRISTRSICDTGIKSQGTPPPRTLTPSCGIDPHAIHIQGRHARIGAADIDAADIAIADGLQPGQARQQLRHGTGANALDLSALDDADIGHDVGDRLFDPRGRHDGLRKLGGRLRQRRELDRLQGGEKRQHGKARLLGTDFHEKQESKIALTVVPDSAWAARCHAGVTPPCWPVSGLMETTFIAFPDTWFTCPVARVMKAASCDASTYRCGGSAGWAGLGGSPSCFPLNCGV